MSFIENLSKSKIKTNLSYYSSIDSIQTNITTDEIKKLKKIKTVSFNGGVEIIDVESYKEYNQSGILKLETLEKNCIDDFFFHI